MKIQNKIGISHESNFAKKLTEIVGELLGLDVGALVAGTVGFGVGAFVG